MCHCGDQNHGCSIKAFLLGIYLSNLSNIELQTQGKYNWNQYSLYQPEAPLGAENKHKYGHKLVGGPVNVDAVLMACSLITSLFFEHF